MVTRTDCRRKEMAHVQDAPEDNWVQTMDVQGPDDSVKVLAREDIWLKRKVREAIEIKIGQPVMNRYQGYELPPSTINFCCHVIVVKAIT